MAVDLAQLKAIFAAAAAQPNADARDAFLSQACQGDAELRQRVEALLAAHDGNDSFLQLPHGGESSLPRLSELPGTKIGRYKLLEQIGEGGFGVVFMAEQEDPVRRRVALKIIKLGMDTRQVVARFEAERQALALMDHPNVAKVFDGGATETGRPYFVMELVKGAPITDYCDKNNLSVHQRLEIFGQVCSAVQHAHQKGLIHRDIKPTNVLVTTHDDRPMAKVIDFGVAKAIEARLTEKTLFTEFRQLIGTPAYMSPEQAAGGLDVDTRSDVYSLGVLLYELLTGSPPFDSKELRSNAFANMQRIICEVEPPTPSSRLSTPTGTLASVAAQRSAEPKRLAAIVRGEVDWIVMRALEKDRKRRYQSANALIEDLQRYLTDQPVEARRASRWYRVRKFARRNKAAFATTSIVALALIAGTAASTWQAIRATRAESLADSRLHDERQAREELKRANDELATNLKRAESAEQLAEKRSIDLAKRFYEVKFPVAAAAFRNDKFELARTTLDECPVNERHWEWRLLDQLVQRRTGLNIRGRLLAQFTPDGKQVVAVDGDNDERCIAFWNSTTGAKERVMARHTTAIKQCRMDPTGQRIATGTADGQVFLWDVARDALLWSVNAHTKQSDGFDFSNDGSRLASVGWGGTLKVFACATGKELVSAECEHHLRSVDFNPNDTRLVTGRREWRPTEVAPARVWDAQTGEQIFTISGSSSRSAIYSPDGKYIVLGGNNGSVRICDAESGEIVRKWHADPMFISGLEYSPDGRQLASAGTEAIRTWDPTTGAKLSEFRGRAGANYVAFSPDGKRLASSGANLIYITNLEPEPPFSAVQVESVPGRVTAVRLAKFSPDGKHLLAVTSDGEVKYFDTHSQVEDWTLTLSGCQGADLSPDGRQFAISTGDLVLLGETATGKITCESRGHTGRVHRVRYSPDGAQLASTGADATIRLGDCAAGTEIAILKGHKTQFGEIKGGTIWAIAFQPGGKQLASVALDGLKIWDLETHKMIRSVPATGGFTSVTYSTDGKQVLAGGADKLVHAWDAESGDAIPGFATEHENTVWVVKPTADGSRFISGDEAGRINIWTTDTRFLVDSLQGARGSIYAIEFSPDGNTMAVAKANGTIEFAEIGATPEVLAARKAARHASKAANDALKTHDWTEAAISAIKADESLSPETKPVAIRLAEQRLTSVRQTTPRRVERVRRNAQKSKEMSAASAPPQTPASRTPVIDAETLNGYAWELLTIEPVSMREPAAALGIVLEAIELGGDKHPGILDTLAQAYRDTGDPVKAAETSQRAFDISRPESPNRKYYSVRVEEFKAALKASGNGADRNAEPHATDAQP